MKGLVLRGLVLQDIYRSEKSVSSKWLSSSQNESTYQVKAVVTGGTLNFGTVVAREVLVTDLGNVGFCGVTFQQPGLVNIAIKANPTEPFTFSVGTVVDSRNVRYSLSAQSQPLAGPSDTGFGNASTDLELTGAALEDRVFDLLSSARGSRFEDGISSPFSKALTRLVADEGKAAVIALTKMSATADVNVVAETLRSLARLEDSSFSDERRWLLEAGLSHKSPFVRDVAVSGLALIGDPRSIPSLRKAIDQERIAPLRADMVELVNEMEGERRAKAS